jgi:hypothetical protein
MEAQLRETQQNLERTMQKSDRKKETVLNKMGDLAEKYHQEREKNKQLVLELQRMNETLRRFELSINALQKEKKTMARDLEVIREKYSLSNKLMRGGGTEERKSSEEDQQRERRKSEYR